MLYGVLGPVVGGYHLHIYYSSTKYEHLEKLKHFYKDGCCPCFILGNCEAQGSLVSCLGLRLEIVAVLDRNRESLLSVFCCVP